VQFPILYTHLLNYPHQYGDYLGINIRILTAENLQSKLVKLPVPAGLGTIIPEHGPHVIPFCRLGLVIDFMLDEGPCTGGGTFRPQGQTAVTAILKGIHLFLDNIGGISDSTFKKLGMFEDWQSHL
jgi:hypothetical protein